MKALQFLICCCNSEISPLNEINFICLSYIFTSPIDFSVESNNSLGVSRENSTTLSCGKT